MKKEVIINDKKIAFSIALKYNQLKREKLEHLEVAQFVDYLFNYKWKSSYPDKISDAVIEIMDANANNIVAYLSNLAVLQSKDRDLSDFEDLFSKGISK